MEEFRASKDTISKAHRHFMSFCMFSALVRSGHTLFRELLAHIESSIFCTRLTAPWAVWGKFWLAEKSSGWSPKISEAHDQTERGSNLNSDISIADPK